MICDRCQNDCRFGDLEPIQVKGRGRQTLTAADGSRIDYVEKWISQHWCPDCIQKHAKRIRTIAQRRMGLQDSIGQLRAKALRNETYRARKSA